MAAALCVQETVGGVGAQDGTQWPLHATAAVAEQNPGETEGRSQSHCSVSKGTLPR